MSGAYFWAGISGLFLGIFFVEFFTGSISLTLLFFVFALALYVSSRKRIAVVCAILCCMAGAGALRGYVAEVRTHSPLDRSAGERITVVGTISDEPDRREQSVRLTIDPKEIKILNGKKIRITHAPQILVPVRLPASFSYGDTVQVQGVLGRPEVFETTNGRLFDYPAYLAARNIYFEIPFAQVERVAEAGISIRGTLFSIKNIYLSGLQNALTEPMSSLAGGITVGDKRSLGERLSEQFRRTGLVHIVVLSGYNITLIVGALMLLVRHRSLTSRFLFGGGIIIAFVLMTGASATGVRAGAMAVIALLAAATFRKYAIDRALAITAAAMALWNPHVLLHDPGFQLSVLATLGLIHIAPVIERKISFMPARLQLRAITAATLGTQIAVMPLLLYQTGILSVVSLPANLLILPVIPAAMVASFVAGIAGILDGPFAVVAGLPAHILLLYVIKMTEFFASIPFGTVTLPAFSGWLVVAVYVVGVFTLWRLRSAVQSRSN